MQNADYEMLILEILYEREGRAERSDVLGSIGKKLEGRLRPGDHEGTPGGRCKAMAERAQLSQDRLAPWCVGTDRSWSCAR